MTLLAAEEELAWFYLQREGELGFTAQNYESSGGGVWDEKRISTTHGIHVDADTGAMELLNTGRLSPRHRGRLEQETLVTPTVLALTSADQATSHAAFQTCAAPHFVTNFFAVKGRIAPLVGLALVQPAMAKAWEKLERTRDTSMVAALAFLDGQLKDDSGAKRAAPSWMFQARAQANRAFEAVLDHYEEMRVEREKTPCACGHKRRQHQKFLGSCIYCDCPRFRFGEGAFEQRKTRLQSHAALLRGGSR